jgi:hypothetical protein
MKNLNLFKGLLLFSFILLFLMIAPYAIAQQDTKLSPPIPDELNKIFMRSCIPCHATNGKAIALNFINFDAWTKYTPEKQAKKANMILYVLNKEKMPPKAARENRPDIIPTKEQIAAVKKWADALNPEKK